MKSCRQQRQHDQRARCMELSFLFQYEGLTGCAHPFKINPQVAMDLNLTLAAGDVGVETRTAVVATAMSVGASAISTLAVARVQETAVESEAAAAAATASAGEESAARGEAGG